jgi:nucleotide-binding universal stress UspA family protein
MFSRIVAGFDGSAGGHDAVAMAAELADRFDAELVVASVAPEPYAKSVLPALPSDALVWMTDEARASAEKVASEVGGKVEIRASLSPARGLHQIVMETGADLLVIGSTGAGPGRVKGSHIARALMSGGPCTVAIAPLGWRDGSRSLDRVGVAIAGSPESEEALRLGIGLSEGGTLRAIAVATPLDSALGKLVMLGSKELGEISKEVAKGHLDEAVSLMPDESIVAERRIPEGGAAEALRRETEEGLDLLLLGSRSYGPVRRVLLGSVTSDLVGDAGCALMVSPRAGLED